VNAINENPPLRSDNQEHSLRFVILSGAKDLLSPRAQHFI